QTIKCVLVDDELPGLTYLRALCSRLPDVEVVKSFNNPVKFLDEIETLDFDVCILDIAMPGMNGIELAERLVDRGIIFSTAYHQYAADAFDLNAIDYIRKPYQLGRLEAAFLKVRDWLSTKRNVGGGYIELNTDKGRARIDHLHIAFVTVAEDDRRDKTIVLKDGRNILAKNITFNGLIQQLPNVALCQINRKTIVALDTVSSYTQQWVYCSVPEFQKSDIQFQLSEQYREDFWNKLSR